jgi:hypothetical protein
MTPERVERIKARIEEITKKKAIYKPEHFQECWIDELAGLRLLLAVQEHCDTCGLATSEYLDGCEDCCIWWKLRRIAEGSET